jgi:hypothetical protein
VEVLRKVHFLRSPKRRFSLLIHLPDLRERQQKYRRNKEILLTS